jgi:hypothetical protein
MAARLLLRTMGRDDILGELSVCPFGNSVWLRRKKCVMLVGPLKSKIVPQVLRSSFSWGGTITVEPYSIIALFILVNSLVCF